MTAHSRQYRPNTIGQPAQHTIRGPSYSVASQCVTHVHVSTREKLSYTLLSAQDFAVSSRRKQPLTLRLQPYCLFILPYLAGALSCDASGKLELYLTCMDAACMLQISYSDDAVHRPPFPSSGIPLRSGYAMELCKSPPQKDPLTQRYLPPSSTTTIDTTLSFIAQV